MLLRPFLNDATGCASYLFGCGTHAKLAVVDPHAELVDEYLATAAALGAPIVAVLETHVQADHISGLPALVARTGATAYLPADTGVEFEHVALADGDVVELGIGLGPDLTGRQLGESFLRAQLDYASQNWQPETFRLFVAAWNERAIRLYERLGFREVARETRHFELVGDHEFIQMERAA